jgi:hypothetical protein
MTTRNYVLLRDRFGDVHAAEIRGEVTQANVFAVARDFLDSFCADDGEELELALCHARDAGAARLKWGEDGTHLYGSIANVADGKDGDQ